MAPEILKENQFTKASDWWSFGIVIYEFLHGFTPFYYQSKQQVIHDVIKEHPKFKKDLSFEAKDLIEKLLKKEPRARLGWRDDAQEIKDHPFFCGVDWNAINLMSCEVPWKPQFKDTLKMDYADKENILEFEIAEDLEAVDS